MQVPELKLKSFALPYTPIKWLLFGTLSFDLFGPIGLPKKMLLDSKADMEKVFVFAYLSKISVTPAFLCIK